MGLKNYRFLTIIFIILLTTYAEAAWQAPVTVVSGSWGPNDDQFGIEYGNTNDVFGGPLYILPDGGLILSDLTNGRMKIYSSSGVLTKVVKCVKGSTAGLNAECRMPVVNSIQTTSDGNIWVGTLEYLKQQVYSLYSPTGQLIRTSSTRPLELGVVSEKALGNGQYKVMLKYPDKELSLMGVARMDSYLRDRNGNLYGYRDTQVIRYTAYGKESASLFIPEKKIDELLAGEDEPRITVLEEYGSPIIAPNGDVYTWKRTPHTYSIIKWTWVDNLECAQREPDVPTTNLTAAPSTTGVSLTWLASPQDPE
jgi:hypothetical protein